MWCYLHCNLLLWCWHRGLQWAVYQIVQIVKGRSTSMRIGSLEGLRFKILFILPVLHLCFRFNLPFPTIIDVYPTALYCSRYPDSVSIYKYEIKKWLEDFPDRFDPYLSSLKERGKSIWVFEPPPPTCHLVWKPLNFNTTKTFKTDKNHVKKPL